MRPIVEKCYVTNSQKKRKIQVLLIMLFVCSIFILLLTFGQKYLDFEISGDLYHESYYITVIIVCLSFGILIKKIYGVAISSDRCSENLKYKICRVQYGQSPSAQRDLPKNFREREKRCETKYTNENEQDCCKFVYHLSNVNTRVGLQEWIEPDGTENKVETLSSRKVRTRLTNIIFLAMFVVTTISLISLLRLRYQEFGNDQIEWIFNLTGGIIYVIVTSFSAVISFYFLYKVIKVDEIPIAPKFSVTAYDMQEMNEQYEKQKQEASISSQPRPQSQFGQPGSVKMGDRKEPWKK